MPSLSSVVQHLILPSASRDVLTGFECQVSWYRVFWPLVFKISYGDLVGCWKQKSCGALEALEWVWVMTAVNEYLTVGSKSEILQFSI